MIRVALTGGGTAGHITPLLAVAEQLREASADVAMTVIAMEGGRERDILPDWLDDIVDVPKLPFPRTFSTAVLGYPFRLWRAIRRLRHELRTRSVDVVVGFGGYIAAPAYLAARAEGIPVVIHEANRVPGLANRMAQRFAEVVATCFPDTPLRSAQVIGMPLPRSLTARPSSELREEARSFFGLHEGPVLLVMGGSSGAKKINETVWQRARELVETGWQVLHLVGPSLDQPTSLPEGYVALKYCHRMDLAYSLASLAVCRAGAATVSEMAVAGVPAIFVPYHVGNGEQEQNARYLVDRGAAIVVGQESFTPEAVDSVVIPLLADGARREEMSRQARSLAVVDAATVLAELVLKAAQSREEHP